MTDTRILPVTPAAATVLADAAGRAYDDGAVDTDVPYVVRALVASAANPGLNRLGSAATALDLDLPPLINAHEDRALSSDLAELSPSVRALVAVGTQMAAVNGELAASTVHLFAAALEAGAISELSKCGVTANLLIACANRDADDAPTDDLVRDTPPEPVPVTSVLPTTPRTEDLHRRTTGRLSATVARFLRGALPTTGHSSTPLGRSRMRRYTLAFTIQYASALTVMFLAGQHIARVGPPWLFVLLATFIYSPHIGGRTFLLVRLPLAALVPPVIGALVVLNVVAALIEEWCMVWLLRVDRSDPRLPASVIWRSYWRESWLMGQEWVGNAPQTL